MGNGPESKEVMGVSTDFGSPLSGVTLPLLSLHTTVAREQHLPVVLNVTRCTRLHSFIPHVQVRWCESNAPDMYVGRYHLRTFIEIQIILTKVSLIFLGLFRREPGQYFRKTRDRLLSNHYLFTIRDYVSIQFKDE